jgi:hypothetical protein
MSIAHDQPEAAAGFVVTPALFVAWQPSDSRQPWRPVGKLECADGIYRFGYTKGALRGDFRPFPGLPDLSVCYEAEELFPLFKNRLLSESRPEYEEFLRWGGFLAGERPDPISILGITEGLRQTDSVEVFPCPQPDAAGCYVNTFFLHGLRWLPPAALERVATLEPGDALRLMFDVQNEHDRQAVAVRTASDRTLIGYFPRYLAHDAWTLVVNCDPALMHLSVVQLNGNAPLQNRVLCRLRSCWPDGFAPCSSDEFSPLAAEK